MAETTGIEWADTTWSPWEGCTQISEGCTNCYALAMNKWLRKGENWGPGAPRRIYSEDHWGKPIKWQRDAPKFDTLHHRRRRVFPSVCDPFDNEAPGILRERLWQIIKLTPALDWLLLTKRIGNARQMVPRDWMHGHWPSNVWIGATMVNQEEVDRDLWKLFALPAHVRFLSCEPMLGPILLPGFDGDASFCNICQRIVRDGGGAPHSREHGAFPETDLKVTPTYDMLHWVICGGESGPEARPMDEEWARGLKDECRRGGTPFFMKQMGGRRDKRGRLEDLPEDLRIREFPL